jgi:hypothetical protein
VIPQNIQLRNLFGDLADESDLDSTVFPHGDHIFDDVTKQKMVARRFCRPGDVWG